MRFEDENLAIAAEMKTVSISGAGLRHSSGNNHKHRKEHAHEHNKEIVVAIAFEFMVKLVKHLVSYFLPIFMASIFICLSASCSISC